MWCDNILTGLLCSQRTNMVPPIALNCRHKRSELSWRDSKCPLLQKFHSSDILQKRCLVWLLKINCLWHPSAWPSARLWLARARLSPSLSPWVPPSPSPWTPRSLLLLCLRGRRSPVLQLLDEMPQEEWSSWIGKLKKLQLWKSNAHLVSPTHLCHFLRWKLRGSPLSVIIAVKGSPPMLVWCLTKEFHTQWCCMFKHQMFIAVLVDNLVPPTKIWNSTKRLLILRLLLIPTSILFLRAGASIS